MWWEQIRTKLTRLENLTVLGLPAEASQELAALANRTMRLQCSIQDGQVWLTDGQTNVHLEPSTLMAPGQG